MDAAQKLFKNAALFLTLALLTAALGYSQQLQVSATSVALAGNQAQSISVTSSTGGAIAYSVTNLPSPNWLSFFSDNGYTTPDTLRFQIGNAGLCTAGCSTTITLHPTAAGNGSDVSINVTFTPGSSSGGGVVTASSTLVTMAANVGGSTSTTISLSTTSTSPITLNTPTSSMGWLSASLSSFTVSAGNPVTVTLFGNAYSLSAATYTGTIGIAPGVGSQISINVTFNVGGSGTSSGTITANPTVLNLSYPGTNAGSVTIGTNNSALTSFNFAVTSNGTTVNWLYISVSGLGYNSYNGLPFGTYSIYVDALAGHSLPTGTYTGIITLTNPNNSGDTTTITVNLSVNGGGTSTLSASPTALTFNTTPASGISSQTVYVTVPGSNQFTVYGYTAGGGSWLSIQNCGSNFCTLTGSQYITVIINPSGLVSGQAYSGTIQLSSGGVQVNVSVAVNTSGSGTSTNGIASPTTLNFAYQSTQTTNIPYQTVTIAPSGTYTVTPSVTTTQQWLAVSGTTGTGPANLIVSVIPQAMTAGTYQGSLTINTPSGTQVVTVNLTVSSTVVLESNPGSINFSYQAGGAAQQYNLQVTASDNSAIPLTVTSSTSWIGVSGATSSATGGSYTITVTPSGLCNGLNTGTVTATASGAANSPLSIPVVVLVSGSSATSCGTSTGPLTLGASTLTFNAVANSSAPAGQSLSVNASSSTLFSVSYSPSGNWLTVLPSGSSCCYTNSNLTVSVNQAGLTAGTYTGYIYLTSNSTTQTVTVSLVVTASGSGSVSASPSTLSFSYQVGGTTPAGQNVQVSSASGSAGVNFTVSASSTGSWLSASVNGTVVSNGSSLTTPSTLTVNVNPTGLQANTYSGTITLTPSGGTAVTVSVTLTVQAAPTVSATPTSVSFSYRAGDPAPSTQTVTVSGGGASLTFSAQATSTNNWLVVSPASGTTPATLTVSVNPNNLSAGNYQGSITVTGTGSATGNTTITVALAVTAPLPTITKVSSAASYSSASIAPGEVIAIFGTSLGPSTQVYLALDQSGLVSTNIGNVQVMVNGFACPMIYASSTQVSAVVPYEVAIFQQANVVVKFLGQSSNGVTMPIATTVPGLFTANSSGTGPGAISNADGSANSPANPAAKGSTVAVYLTGEGQTSPKGVTGKVTTVSNTPPLTPAPLLPIAVLLDGQPAGYAFAGEAPSLVSGVMQLNIQIPQTARSGDLSLVVSIGGNSSQAGVTVSVR